jgi:hypothetical protein
VLGDGWSNATTGNPESFGDYGYCAQTCNCDADCSAPGLHCTPFEDAAMAKASLKQGYCATKITNPPLPCAG